MKPRLIIVEDDLLQQRLYELLCERFSYDKAIVTSCAELCALLKRNPEVCDLVILDRTLGAEDGLKCISEIRSLTRLRRNYLPVIAVTAHALVGDREMCITAGADDYLSKPFTLAQFEDMVSKWVKIARGNQQSGLGFVQPPSPGLFNQQSC